MTEYEVRSMDALEAIEELLKSNLALSIVAIKLAANREFVLKLISKEEYDHLLDIVNQTADKHITKETNNNEKI